jgi:hypothetical protein
MLWWHLDNWKKFVVVERLLLFASAMKGVKFESGQERNRAVSRDHALSSLPTSSLSASITAVLHNNPKPNHEVSLL